MKRKNKDSWKAYQIYTNLHKDRAKKREAQKMNISFS